MFDCKTYLENNHIQYSTHGVNCSPGWINTQCPFCNDRSNHIGFNIRYGYSKCWRCGYHSLLETIKMLSGVGWDKAKEVIKSYQTDTPTEIKKKIVTHADKLKFPFGTTELKQAHKNYLIERKFNPNKIIKHWDIKATGPISDYKWRIIIPIHFNGKLVSYQGRDITGKQELRYKTCKIEKEVIHHKHLVYGLDQCKSHQCIVVEGVTDVWRIGEGSVSTFGIEYKQEQVYLLAERFNKVFILFDEEKQAQRQADKLGNQLVMFGIEVERVEIEEADPGSMNQRDANQLKKELIGE